MASSSPLVSQQDHGNSVEDTGWQAEAPAPLFIDFGGPQAHGNSLSPCRRNQQAPTVTLFAQHDRKGAGAFSHTLSRRRRYGRDNQRLGSGLIGAGFVLHRDRYRGS